MSSGLTSSEKFVAGLCEQSFLKLWTHPNPKGKNGKELCDCLVVCGNHIVIVSVKDCEYRETGDSVGWERWTRSAIDESAAQIAGAERWLKSSDRLIRHDGRIITLPPQDTRRYHRVAVALGAAGRVPLKWGDLGKGFIHVCDESSLTISFRALDTISDFVNFLSASENLNSSARILLTGGVEDLIALYLGNGRSLQLESPKGSRDHIIIGDQLWQEYVKSEKFRREQIEFEGSYAWDRLIEIYTADLLTDGMFDMYNKNVSKDEMALVTMALQPRENRVVLAKGLLEFLKNPDLKLAARCIQGAFGSAFVFASGSSADREERSKELALRCFVVRGRMPATHTVVGISTDRPGTSKIGYSSDIVYLHMPEWSEKDELAVRGIQNDLGYFKTLGQK